MRGSVAAMSGDVRESGAAGVVVARGSRAAEEALLRLLAPHLAAGGDLRALAAPVRVVVPSRSLRLHVAALLARRHGALLGVQVQTLNAVAREIVERRDPEAAAAADGEHAFEVLVRRLARAEPALARGLDRLVDGYAAASATVRDLLDAGLLPVHAGAADEALAAARQGGGPRATAEQVERARALVRVAARVEDALAGHRAVRYSGRLRHAADLLAEDPEAALPARAVVVHGFADATGVATDLIEALLVHHGARLVLDDPPDAAGPGEPLGPDAAPAELPRDEAFSVRFRERVAGAAGVALPDGGGGEDADRTTADVLAAAGAEAEVREVALRVRRLLDGGVRPEGIGIVARDLVAYRAALRRHLGTLGVPFSGVDEPGTLTPAGRRVRGLLDLLRRRDDLPADRWLDAVARLPAPVAVDGGSGSGETQDGEANDSVVGASDGETGGERASAGDGREQRPPFVDLRLALATLAAGRLRDVARLDPRRLRSRSIALPIRRGLAYADDEPGAGGRATRRRIGTGRVLAAAGAARDLVGRLGSWPERAAPGVHLDRLDALLAGDLGWDRAGDETAPVFAALDRLRTALPPSLEIDFDELRLVLARGLETVGRTPIGGRGGGVQVLSVTEARGRTWEHLFVVGVHRGAFPRTVREDPLLPDSLRGELAAVLPDLARKRAGFAEERHLFAQLLSASRRTTVSWLTHDDEGQPLGPSPLAERLVARRGGRASEVAPVPPATAAARGAGSAETPGPLPARERATAAAVLGASRRRLEPLLAAAVAEARETAGPPPLRLDPRRIAAARLAVLDEIDPDRRTPEGRAAAARLGPYFGFLGRREGRARDPRGADLWATHAERVATCPWQHALRRLLAVEPTPDPLQALPGSDPLLLGIVVHEVLAGLVERAQPAPPAGLAEALAAEPVRVPWPEPEAFEAMLLAAAEEALGRGGAALPGLVRALAEQARPLLERARELDWSGRGGPPAVLAAEVAGEVAAGTDRPRRLRFRADRVDRGAGGPLVTDYKTGRPITEAKTAAARTRHLMARVAGGRNLQAVAYAVAAAQAGRPGAAGRYLYLAAEPERADLRLAADDADALAAFHGAVDAVGAAWDEGAFFPRLVDARGNTPPPCGFCEVAEACLQGDSGARLRLGGWVARRQDAAAAGAGPPAGPEAAILAVWGLGTPEEADPK